MVSKVEYTIIIMMIIITTTILVPMFLAQITYPTHLMNTDSSPVSPDGRQPSNQANPLGL